MGLAPAAVVVWADEHHRDVELALLDVGDLQVGAALRIPSRRSRRLQVSRRRSRTARAADADGSADVAAERRRGGRATARTRAGDDGHGHRTVSHDSRRVIPGPPPPPARDRPPQDGTERVRAQDSRVATAVTGR